MRVRVLIKMSSGVDWVAEAENVDDEMDALDSVQRTIGQGTPVHAWRRQPGGDLGERSWVELNPAHVVYTVAEPSD